MLLGGFLWNYTPFTPANVAPAVVAARAAYVSAQPRIGPLAFAHSDAPYSLAGIEHPMFGADFYDRFHISTLSLDLGNLVGDQERTVSVWNAYRRARILEAVTLADGEGIEVGGQPLPPLQFAPQQERVYTISISTDGPPVIQASITWDFDEGHGLTVTVAGSRVTAWAWPPDWAAGILERLEWRTDVLQAYRAEEQRRALREWPRRSLEFTTMAVGTSRRILEAALWNWGARVWALPFWPDGLDLAAPLAAGATTIPADTATRDYQPGGLAILMGEDPRVSEVVEVEEAQPAQLVLARPTTRAWPAGTRLYPARPATLDDQVALPRFDGETATARVRFAMVDPQVWDTAAGDPTHRGLPVLELRPNWTSEPDLQLERKLTELDGGTGLVYREDQADMPLTRQRLAYTAVTREEIDAWRKRLHAMRGKQGSVWLPTWSRDLVVAAQVADNALAIDVEWAGYTVFHKRDPNRRDLRLQLRDGTVLYRRVTASTELDANTERLAIDTSLGVTVAADDFVLVSFMALSRNEADAVELAWWNGQTVDTRLAMRSFRHEL